MKGPTVLPLTPSMKEKRIARYERWIAKRTKRMSIEERDAELIAFYQNKIAELKEAR